MHTGEPVLSDEGRYRGMGVHRAARIMAAGHGGQVLASQATASLLADDGVPGVTLRDLGEHRLKDMDRPERIFQLEIDELPSTFPPLRADAESRAAEELATPERQPIYRRPLVVGPVACIVATAIAIPLFALERSGSSGASLTGLSANSVGVVDPASGALVDQVADVPPPSRVAAGANAIWVTSARRRTASRGSTPPLVSSGRRSRSETGRAGSPSEPAPCGSRTLSTGPCRESTQRQTR
jgi:hypothetical protein